MIKENLHISNVFAVLHFAELLEDSFMKTLCINYFVDKYAIVSTTPEYKELSTSVKAAILEKRTKNAKKQLYKLKRK